MRGAKINAANEAICNLIPELQKISDDNPDAEIKIAILEYSTGARWLTPQPVLVNDFKWHDLVAGGNNDLGAACEALNEKLSRRSDGFCDSLMLAPIIILLSDNEPTNNYKQSLNNLKYNGYFMYGTIIAIAIGDEANTEVLEEFTESREAVMKAHNLEKLPNIIYNTIYRGKDDGLDVICDYCGKIYVHNRPHKCDEMLKILIEIKNKCGIEVFNNSSKFLSVFNDFTKNDKQHKAIGRLLRDILAEFNAFFILIEARKNGNMVTDKVLVDEICEKKLIDKEHAERAVAYLAHVLEYKINCFKQKNLENLIQDFVENFDDSEELDW